MVRIGVIAAAAAAVAVAVIGVVLGRDAYRRSPDAIHHYRPYAA